MELPVPGTGCNLLGPVNTVASDRCGVGRGSIFFPVSANVNHCHNSLLPTGPRASLLRRRTRCYLYLSYGHTDTVLQLCDCVSNRNSTMDEIRWCALQCPIKFYITCSVARSDFCRHCVVTGKGLQHQLISASKMDKSRQKSLFSFFSKCGKSADSQSVAPEEESDLNLASTSTSEPPIAESGPTTSQCEHEPEKQSQPSKKLKHDSFREQWRKDFTWLETDDSMTMFCTICLKTRQKNGFTRGSKNYQFSALTEHSKSASHVLAVTTSTRQMSIIPHSDAACASQRESLLAQLRTVLCMAKHGMPASCFPCLIELQESNGLRSLKSGEIYAHHESVSQMEKCLADVTKAEIKEKLDSNDFLGIVIDETLNCTLDKKLILYARCENRGDVENLFLGNYTIENGTAECVFEMLVKVLEEWGITDKVIGLGSDGASVMMGVHNGVGVRLKRQRPALVHIHCAAHRVALATKDATESVDSVAEYRKCLQQIFKLYRASGDRTHRLKEMCDALDDLDYLSLKHPISVRWLSLGKAVKAVKNIYPALTLELEEETNRNRLTAAGNLYKKCKMFSFVAMTYMLSDIIPLMEKLNLVFQKETVNLAMIKPVVESTKASLQNLLQTRGLNEEEFFTAFRRNGGSVFQTITLTHVGREQAYTRMREVFIQELIDSLTKRFPDQQLGVVSALATVFDRQRYPPADPAGPLDAYAVTDLTLLSRHFATIINGPRAQADFNLFKRTLSGYGGEDSFSVSCRLVIKNFAQMFPDFAALAKIALVIPVSSVPAERGFSVQNQIKTDRRNRLSEDRVSRLMTLKIHAKEMAEFNVGAACDRFLSMKDRRK